MHEKYHAPRTMLLPYSCRAASAVFGNPLYAEICKLPSLDSALVATTKPEPPTNGSNPEQRCANRCLGRRLGHGEYARIRCFVGFFNDSGGGEGIRTPGTLTGTAVFKTAAFDHSATPPSYYFHCRLFFLHLRALGPNGGPVDHLLTISLPCPLRHPPLV